MKPNGYLILIFVICSKCLFGQTETKLSSGIAFDGEPNMVANPSNPREVVVAWMGLGISGSTTVITIRTRSSNDGGKTWGSIVSLPHFSNDWGSADPTMAWNKNGKLYIAYIDYRQAEDSGGVFFFSSSDAGKTWNFESKILDVSESPSKMPLDRPWLTVMNGGVYNGYLMITTKPAPWIPAPNRPYFKISKDGKSWSALRFLDTANYLTGNFIQAPMAAVSSTASGKFIAAYPSYVTTQSIYPKYFLAKSQNGGASFTFNDLVVNPGNAGDTNLKSGYQLLADPWNANRIVFVRIDNKAGDADVVANSSWDEGNTWNSAVRINDDNANNGVLQDLAWASWNSQGALAVCWRDRRNGGAGFTQAADCYCAVSTDSGKSFGKNIRMSSQSAPYHNILTQNGNDFMGCHLNGDTLLAVWGKVNNSKLEIWCSAANWKLGTAGIENLIVSESLFQVKIFPNPANEKMRISYSVTPDGPVFITDITGKKVMEISEKNAGEISVKTLKNGIYFLRGMLGGVVFSEPFEIVR